MSTDGKNPGSPEEDHVPDTPDGRFREYLDLVDQTVDAITDEMVEARLQRLLERQANVDQPSLQKQTHQSSPQHGGKETRLQVPRRDTDVAGGTRLLTNIGRLWTGSEILSNAAIVTGGDRIAWVGPASELPPRIPGVLDDIIDVGCVENLGGGLVTPGLIDAHTHPVYAGNRWPELAMKISGYSKNQPATQPLTHPVAQGPRVRAPVDRHCRRDPGVPWYAAG